MKKTSSKCVSVDAKRQSNKRRLVQGLSADFLNLKVYISLCLCVVSQTFSDVWL